VEGDGSLLEFRISAVRRSRGVAVKVVAVVVAAVVEVVAFRKVPLTSPLLAVLAVLASIVISCQEDSRC
jgi:hypothetical protein